MGLEDKHLDVLQNIEFAIVSVYRERSDLLDYDVMRALDALIDVYRAESRGHIPKEIHLPEQESFIFQRTKDMCEFRLGRKELKHNMQAISREEETVDEILACLRKIRRSVDRWNKRGGLQGYLQFVCQYVK
ncbi:MAG: hypothetical protein ACE5JD_12690 [Candidatus Methylomirabilia bacterium]